MRFGAAFSTLLLLVTLTGCLAESTPAPTPAPVELAISISPEASGTVQLIPSPVGDGKYIPGTNVRISATPNPDFQFDAWAGDIGGSDNPTSITIRSDMLVVAVFVAAEGLAERDETRTPTISKPPSDVSKPAPAVSLGLPQELEVGRTYTVAVSLENLSPEGGSSLSFGAGVHVRLENAVFVSADEDDFTSVGAFDRNAEEVGLSGSTILEFYQSDFPPNHTSTGSFSFRLTDPPVTNVVVRYRAWIFDPTDKVNGEDYIVHDPPQASNLGSECGGAPRFLQCSTYDQRISVVEASLRDVGYAIYMPGISLGPATFQAMDRATGTFPGELGELVSAQGFAPAWFSYRATGGYLGANAEYSAEDTRQHLNLSALALDEQVRGLIREWQERTSDDSLPEIVIVSHSLGGAVAAHWASWADAAILASVRLVFTLDSPLRGTGERRGSFGGDAGSDLLDSEELDTIAHGTTRLDFAQVGNTEDEIVRFEEAFTPGRWREMEITCARLTDIGDHFCVLDDPDALRFVETTMNESPPLWSGQVARPDPLLVDVPMRSGPGGGGTSRDHAGVSCMSINNSHPVSGDGVYWIDPDGSGGGEPFEVYCEMSTKGGGWMLILSFQDPGPYWTRFSEGPIGGAANIGHFDGTGLGSPHEISSNYRLPKAADIFEVIGTTEMLVTRSDDKSERFLGLDRASLEGFSTYYDATNHDGNPIGSDKYWHIGSNNRFGSPHLGLSVGGPGISAGVSPNHDPNTLHYGHFHVAEENQPRWAWGEEVTGSPRRYHYYLREARGQLDEGSPVPTPTASPGPGTAPTQTPIVQYDSDSDRTIATELASGLDYGLAQTDSETGLEDSTIWVFVGGLGSDGNSGHQTFQAASNPA